MPPGSSTGPAEGRTKVRSRWRSGGSPGGAGGSRPAGPGRGAEAWRATAAEAGRSGPRRGTNHGEDA